MAPAVHGKPGRSEEGAHDLEEQERLAALMRQKFAEEAPKRYLKPSRSEDAPDNAAPDLPLDGPIPEYLKLQTLVQGSPAKIILAEYSGDEPKDFVETDYYKDLYAVDKTHHTTGSGFIQVESNGQVTYHSLPDAPAGAQLTSSQIAAIVDVPEEFVETDYYKDLNAVDKLLHHTTGSGFIQVEKATPTSFHVSAVGLARTRSGCNPATNDWIPAANAPEREEGSKKPNRSEN